MRRPRKNARPLFPLDEDPPGGRSFFLPARRISRAHHCCEFPGRSRSPGQRLSRGILRPVTPGDPPAAGKYTPGIPGDREMAYKKWQQWEFST